MFFELKKLALLPSSTLSWKQLLKRKRSRGKKYSCYPKCETGFDRPPPTPEHCRKAKHGWRLDRSLASEYLSQTQESWDRAEKQWEQACHPQVQGFGQVDRLVTFWPGNLKTSLSKCYYCFWLRVNHVCLTCLRSNQATHPHSVPTTCKLLYLYYKDRNDNQPLSWVWGRIISLAYKSKKNVLPLHKTKK